MQSLQCVVVADDSAVFRKLASTIVKPHCESVALVADRDALFGVLEKGVARVSLLILSADFQGDGIEVLRTLAARSGPRPAVLLVTREPDVAIETEASLLGAIGVLPKPITFEAIRKLLSVDQIRAQPPAAPRARNTPVARAVVLGGAEEQAEILFDVLDLSETGALIVTHGPMAVGDRIDLELRLPEAVIRTGARVVRVQAPAWGTTPGCGVVFEALSRAERGLLVKVVEQLGAG